MQRFPIIHSAALGATKKLTTKTKKYLTTEKAWIVTEKEKYIKISVKDPWELRGKKLF